MPRDHVVLDVLQRVNRVHSRSSRKSRRNRAARERGRASRTPPPSPSIRPSQRLPPGPPANRKGVEAQKNDETDEKLRRQERFGGFRRRPGRKEAGVAASVRLLRQSPGPQYHYRSSPRRAWRSRRSERERDRANAGPRPQLTLARALDCQQGKSNSHQPIGRSILGQLNERPPGFGRKTNDELARDRESGSVTGPALGWRRTI